MCLLIASTTRSEAIEGDIEETDGSCVALAIDGERQSSRTGDHLLERRCRETSVRDLNRSSRRPRSLFDASVGDEMPSTFAEMNPACFGEIGVDDAERFDFALECRVERR